MAPNYEQHRASFDALTIPEPNSGCLLWLGSADGYGYGRVWNTSTQSHFPATYLSLYLSGRPVPKGKIACHTCDNPGCVGDYHLFIGTKKDNTQDMMRKGRGNLTGLEAWRRSREYSQTTRDGVIRLFNGGMLAHLAADAMKVDRKTAREWLKPHGYVSVRERSKTHCSKGHLRTPENTYVVRRNEKICRICAHEIYKRKMAKLGLVATKRVFRNR